MEMNTKKLMESFPENQESNYLTSKDRLSIQVRLNRIEGQVRGVQRQVERDEYCDKIFNQLEAVHSALNAVGIVLMSHHLKSYVASTGLKNHDTIAQEVLKTLSILVNRKDKGKMKNITLQVEGMSCQHCVNSIEGALKEIGAKGKVDLKNNSVDVSFDENQISLELIKETIEEQGYEVV